MDQEMDQVDKGLGMDKGMDKEMGLDQVTAGVAHSTSAFRHPEVGRNHRWEADRGQDLGLEARSVSNVDM